MATMGSYCKAYPVGMLREFGGWSEKAQNLRAPGDADAVRGDTSQPLGADDHLYVHENLTVTDGIFLDENIIFDEVSPDWVRFCKDVLQFEPPPAEP